MTDFEKNKEELTPEGNNRKENTTVGNKADEKADCCNATGKKRSKKPRQHYVDDGHTIYSMDNLPTRFGKANEDKQGPELNRAEKRAAIKAAFETYLPVFLGIIACFTVVFLLMYLWLR